MWGGDRSTRMTQLPMMRDSMDRFPPGLGSSNARRGRASENGSWEGEDGLEVSTQNLQSSRLPPQSTSPTMSTALEFRNAWCESHTNRRPAGSTPHSLSVRECIENSRGDSTIVDVTSLDDPFEGFEVESGSEKEFLIANLRNDAPKDAIEQFREAQKLQLASSATNVQECDTTMNQRGFEEAVRTARRRLAEIDARVYELILLEQDGNDQNPLPSLEYPAPHLILRIKVEEFAKSHMFTVNKHVKPTTLQRREFTRDIYDYARAIGMGKHQADVEVMRVKAAYRKDRGLAGGFKLDESDEESAIGSEINDAAEYVNCIINGMQHGPVDPARAWDEITRLQAKAVDPNSSARKQKHDTADSRDGNGFGVAPGQSSSNEKARALRKQKRKRLKQRHRNGNNQDQNNLADTPPIPKRRKERKKAMRRKRLALGRLEGRMDTKPEDLSPGNIRSELAPRKKLSVEHNEEVDGEIGQHKLVSTDDETCIAEKSTKNLKVESPIAYNRNVHSDTASDLRDLRRRKNKNRKCKTIDSPVKNFGSLDVWAEPNCGDNYTKITPFENSRDTQHDQETRKTSAERKREGVMRDTANDSGSVIPLSELMSTNSVEKMQGRRDRGKRKKTIAATPEAPASGNEFLDLDNRKRQIDIVEAVGNSSQISSGVDDNPKIFNTVSRIPKTKCEVVIHNPPITWWPHATAESNGKASSIDFDSSTSAMESTFSNATKDRACTMSELSLDWNHSGPELDEYKVVPKVTQSSQLKPIATTPTKVVSARSSSMSLQTPESDRKSREISDSSTSIPSEPVQQFDESTVAIRRPTKVHVKSPFFSPPASAEKPKVSLSKKPRQKGGLVSCIPFPPLSSPSFGLLQEKLSHDPFRLLVGVTFLNRTMGKHAIPVFFSLMERYPTPADILAADKEDIISMTHHLGLQAQRAETYKKFAHYWTHDPPVKGKRYRVDHYPNTGDGMDIKAGEVIDDDDPRTAWEIGHMTKGRYAIDSWRIFCRDTLRGQAEGWNGEGREDGFQPEWMRVQPRDKELIACLRWMWLKEGFSWDPVTGEKEVADRKLMEAAVAGKIVWDDRGGMNIVENDGDDVKEEDKI